MADPTVQDLIRQKAGEYGIPPELALAVAEQESGFNPGAVNPTAVNGEHATGTFQLLPSTAKTLGVDAADPRQNIDGGVKYLRQLMDQHNGDLRQVLGAYGGVRTDQTYVPGVMARIPKFRGQAAGQPTPSTLVQPPPQPRTWGGSIWSGAPVDTAHAILSGLDPRTPTGRQNLAGAAGSIALTAVAPEIGGPSLLARGAALAARWGIPAAGAYLGGATEAGGEAVAAGQTPSMEEMFSAGRTQAGQELAGQAVARGVVQPVARRLMSYGVSKQVVQGLQDLRTGTKADLDAAIDSARGVLRQTKARAGAQLESARAGAAARLTGAKQSAQQMIDAARARLGMQAPAVTPAQTGRMVNAAIQGPAKSYLGELGDAVGAAAETGPPVAKAPLQARLDELRQQITPSIAHQPEAIEGVAGYSPEQIQAIAERNPEIAGQLTTLPADHPLPGVVGRVDQMIQGSEGDTIPFSDAHKIKRALDEAVNWDSPAKKQVQQITKGFRQTLRSEMSGHEPYDQATAAYEQAVQLHRRGIAPQLQKVALSNPEALVNRYIKGNEPTGAGMIKELLLGQAAEGGGAEQGQAAWNALRASWSYNKLVSGGIEGLGDRINKLDPDFVKVMYGDSEGQTYLQNLKQIAQGFQDAQSRGVNLVDLTKQVNQQTLLQTAGAGRRAVEGAQAGVAGTKQQAKGIMAGVTDLGQQFQRSSLARVPPPSEMVSTALHAGMFPHSPFTPIRIARAITLGSKPEDLVMWAAFSKPRTQFLINHVLTGPNPGQGIADMIRWINDDAAAGQSPDQPVASHGAPPAPTSVPVPPR